MMFKMTPQDLRALDACRPVMFWAALGKQKGFDPLTVRPIPNMGPEWFTARYTPPDVGVDSRGDIWDEPWQVDGHRGCTARYTPPQEKRT